MAERCHMCVWAGLEPSTRLCRAACGPATRCRALGCTDRHVSAQGVSGCHRRQQGPTLQLLAQQLPLCHQQRIGPACSRQGTRSNIREVMQWHHRAMLPNHLMMIHHLTLAHIWCRVGYTNPHSRGCTLVVSHPSLQPCTQGNAPTADCSNPVRAAPAPIRKLQHTAAKRQRWARPCRTCPGLPAAEQRLPWPESTAATRPAGNRSPPQHAAPAGQQHTSSRRLGG